MNNLQKREHHLHITGNSAELFFTSLVQSKLLVSLKPALKPGRLWQGDRKYRIHNRS